MRRTNRRAYRPHLLTGLIGNPARAGERHDNGVCEETQSGGRGRGRGRLAFCYALAQSGLSDEIALVDRNEELAHGQVLDLVHGQPFFPPVSIHVGHPSDYADAELIVSRRVRLSAPAKAACRWCRKTRQRSAAFSRTSSLKILPPWS